MRIGTRMNTNLFQGILYGLASLIRSFLPEHAKPVVVTSIDHKTRYSNIIKENNSNAIQDFIRTGANVNQFDSHSKTTPLIEAAASGYLQSVRGLIKAGASLSLTDELHYRTPLEWAFFHGHSKVSTYLLDNMCPKDIEFQVKYKRSRFPGLNAFIQTHQIKKLQDELSDIFRRENGSTCLLAALPFEILAEIFSQNYLTLTPITISENIRSMFNKINDVNKEKTPSPIRIDSPLLPKTISKPMIFSTMPVENKHMVKIDNDDIVKKSTSNMKVNW